MKILTGFVLAAAMSFSLSAQGAKGQLAQANAALQAGEADKALGLLNGSAQSGGPAEAYNLRCRVRFTLEQWDLAVGDCEQAVKLAGQSSNNHLWLARALGEKANHASFMNAYSLAKRVRAEFEEAVRLNPRNVEALSDLGEFYYTAPAVVGGGLDKAEGVAAKLDRIDPIRAHELRGYIAAERNDDGTAEREFKLAIARSTHPASQWMTLANYYKHHKRWADMESAIRSGQSYAQRDRFAGEALFDGASMLRQTKRDPVRAVAMLEAYLSSSIKTEKAPTFVAHTWLARLKMQLKDPAAANRERAAALSLAHEYKPAQDLKH
jgi:tetratricopeptide (TPR) repeat protein